MTLVSDPFGGKALIFLHQSRSAGLAVCAILQEEFGLEAALKLGGVEDGEHVSYDAFRDAAATDTFPIYMGHFFYGAHRHVPRPCIYFTMLRDPVDRLLSRYERTCALKGERIDCAQWLAEDFESHDGMVRRICGLGHKEDDPKPFDFVNDCPVTPDMATTAAHYEQAVETLETQFSCMLMRERFVESMVELQWALAGGRALTTSDLLSMTGYSMQICHPIEGFDVTDNSPDELAAVARHMIEKTAGCTSWREPLPGREEPASATESSVRLPLPWRPVTEIGDLTVWPNEAA